MKDVIKESSKVFRVFLSIKDEPFVKAFDVIIRE